MYVYVAYVRRSRSAREEETDHFAAYTPVVQRSAERNGGFVVVGWKGLALPFGRGSFEVECSAGIFSQTPK